MVWSLIYSGLLLETEKVRRQTGHHTSQIIGLTPTPEQNLIAYYEESKNVDRYSKEAIYQESHLLGSPIWYYTTDRKNYRVRFKLIINDVE